MRRRMNGRWRRRRKTDPQVLDDCGHDHAGPAAAPGTVDQAVITLEQ